eukprot:TRINITY_DN1854_c0_g4_i2.p2 TRINITY_DN1854_c0_g4~~TRINITY_DN1854_c0_g4_i2.p2  ORF type:complete len:233 (-),score=31.54 TRINITY_DN1854_c0_g4_i2:1022-1720(-)
MFADHYYCSDNLQRHAQHQPVHPPAHHQVSSEWPASNADGLLTDIVKKEKVGEGSFGTVFAGIWLSRTRVALKRLQSPEDLSMFERERLAWSSLRHPRVLTFFGVWCDEVGVPHLVCEFMPDGNLRDLLRRTAQTGGLPELQRTSFAHDITCGLSFLHSKDIVHGDLSARNVLCARGEGLYVAKLADFAFSFRAPHSRSRGLPFDPKWAAPERLVGQACKTPADVFSLGTTL